MRAAFVKESFFSVPRRELFSFHEHPDAFRLLTPASAGVEVISTASSLAPYRDVVRFAVKFLGLRFRFEMVHTVYEPPRRFVDEQRRGLFTSWRHEHRFIQRGWGSAPASLLRDRIDYRHPLLFLVAPLVRRRLASLFRFRHRITREHLRPAEGTSPDPSMRRVVLTGATGLIGRRIAEILLERNVEVVAFVRDPGRARRLLGDRPVLVTWDFTRPGEGEWARFLGEADGVIHLAGTPLFRQRWTPAFKRDMEVSRVEGTRQLVEAIGALPGKPRVFVSASAVGIYGTDPSLFAGEDASPADDTLARICLRWEEQARRLEREGVRTVQVRTGIVLSRRSGALKELLPLFATGLGGPLGHRRRFMNWIHLEDVARIFVMALLDPDLRGPYNAVAPHPATMDAFAATLARVMRRPCLMRYPPPLLRLMIGEAGEYASGGCQVSSDRIREAGYRYFFEDLDPALRNALAV